MTQKYTSSKELKRSAGTAKLISLFLTFLIVHQKVNALRPEQTGTARNNRLSKTTEYDLGQIEGSIDVGCGYDYNNSPSPGSKMDFLVLPEVGYQFIGLQDKRVSWWTDEDKFVGTYTVRIICQEFSQNSQQVFELDLMVKQGRHLAGNSCRHCEPVWTDSIKDASISLNLESEPLSYDIGQSDIFSGCSNSCSSQDLDWTYRITSDSTGSIPETSGLIVDENDSFKQRQSATVQFESGAQVGTYFYWDAATINSGCQETETSSCSFERGPLTIVVETSCVITATTVNDAQIEFDLNDDFANLYRNDGYFPTFTSSECPSSYNIVKSYSVTTPQGEVQQIQPHQSNGLNRPNACGLPQTAQVMIGGNENRTWYQFICYDQLGTYIISFTATVSDSSGTQLATKEVFQNVLAKPIGECSSNTINLAFKNEISSFQTIINIGETYTFDYSILVSENQDSCTDQNVFYWAGSYKVSTDGDASFVTIPSLNAGSYDRIATFKPTQSSHIGTYVFQVGGALNVNSQTPTSATTQNSTHQIQFEVKNTCAFDENTPSITQPTNTPVTQTYWINDAANSVTYSDFTLGTTPVTGCTTNDLTFNVTVVRKSTNQVVDDPNFLTFDSNAQNITWVSSDSADVDDYTITVTACIEQSQRNTEASFQFDLNLREQVTCNLEAPTLESKNYDLTDGSSPFTSTIEEFKCITNCEENQEIEYELSISPFANFFVTNERQLDWSAATDSDIGVYTIQVVAKVDSQASICNLTAAFNLTIENSAASDDEAENEFQAPRFKTEPSGSSEKKCGDQLDLPSVVALSAFVMELQGEPFFSIANGQIQIDNQDCTVGTYSLQITLSDQTGLSNSYAIEVTIQEGSGETQFSSQVQQQAFSFLKYVKQPFNYSATEWQPALEEPILIESISQTGMCVLKFRKNIIVPNLDSLRILSGNSSLITENEQTEVAWNKIINEDIIQFEIDSIDGTERENVQFETTDFTNERLYIQLFFEKPLSVSQLDIQSLYVNFLQPQIFVTTDNAYLLSGVGELKLNEQVPTQFASEADQARMQQIAQAAERTGVATIVISLLIQFSAKKLISHIWWFFAALQIMILFTMNAQFQVPASTLMFFNAILQIINLEAIKDLFASIVSGVSSTSIFLKIGGIGIVSIIAFPVLLILFLVLKLKDNQRFVKSCSFMEKVGPLLVKVWNGVFWNALIRYFMASFISFWVSSLTTLKNNQTTILDKFISVSLLVAQIIVLVFFTYKLLTKPASELEDAEKRKRIGNMYQNLSTSKRSKLLYAMIFYLQRIAIILAIVFVKSYAVQFLLLQAFLMMKPIYLCYFRPYKSGIDILADFFNDLFLITTHAFQVTLTLYISSDEERYDFGWSYNYMIVAIFTFNFLIVGYIQTLSIIQSKRKKYLTKRKEEFNKARQDKFNKAQQAKSSKEVIKQVTQSSPLLQGKSSIVELPDSTLNQLNQQQGKVLDKKSDAQDLEMQALSKLLPSKPSPLEQLVSEISELPEVLEVSSESEADEGSFTAILKNIEATKAINQQLDQFMMQKSDAEPRKPVQVISNSDLVRIQNNSQLKLTYFKNEEIIVDKQDSLSSFELDSHSSSPKIDHKNDSKQSEAIQFKVLSSEIAKQLQELNDLQKKNETEFKMSQLLNRYD